MAETRERLEQIAKVYREHPFVRTPLPIEAAAFMAALETAFAAGCAALPAGAASPPGPEHGSYEWCVEETLTILNAALEGLPEAEADLPMPRAARRAAAAIQRLRSATHADFRPDYLTEGPRPRGCSCPEPGKDENLHCLCCGAESLEPCLHGRALAAAPPPPGTAPRPDEETRYELTEEGARHVEETLCCQVPDPTFGGSAVCGKFLPCPIHPAPPSPPGGATPGGTGTAPKGDRAK